MKSNGEFPWNGKMSFLGRISYRRRIKKQRKVGYAFVYNDEIYMHTSHVASKCCQESSKDITLLFFKR